MQFLEYFTSAVLIIIVSVIGFVKWYQRRCRKYWEDRGVPVINYSFLGSIWKLFKQPMHEFLVQMHKDHGRIYGNYEFRKPVLTVSEPDLLRDILVKDFHIFSFRRDFEFGDEIINNLVSVLKGEDWKRIRTIITPAFTSKRMRQMSHIINECSKSVCETLEKCAKEGKPAEFKSLFGAFTLDVIARAAFATKIDSPNDPQNIFVKMAKASVSNPSFLRILGFILLPNRIIKKLKLFKFPSSDFFKDVILKVIKERREQGKRYEDMLQLFLDAQDELENEKLKGKVAYDEQEDENDQFGSVTNKGLTSQLKYNKMSEDELIAQCVLFFIVGYETTASALSFMAYSLAVNPKCQEKLIKEVDEAFEKHKDLNYDVIRDMKYLDCAVSETLRMYPPLARSERTATEDYKLGNTGITIEKGTIVGFNIHAMHVDPDFFPNPEIYDPERFLRENANHPQYAYLPFGAGPRNCLGMRFALMEIKLCMCHILRNYTLKKAETTEVPPKFKKFAGFISTNELPLAVERRK